MISLGHFNWPIEAAVFNKNLYWASREYADRFWPTAAGQALQADVGFLPEADIHPV